MRLTVTLPASPDSSGRLVEALRFLMSTTRLEPGCLGCAVWTDADSTVHYMEEWGTEAEMRRRVRSDLFTSLLSVIESAQEPPKVQFEFIATTRGLDYVREARQDPMS
ncbi:MAG TPA: antibiotic biosynthesis monooxygenase [Vicinamibacterales bacterium]|jgi:quinol monooxygenase YgiN|nr:antibiotic biosynthesis monooxygenase [Vicinamibacterales bacterium]